MATNTSVEQSATLPDLKKWLLVASHSRRIIAAIFAFSISFSIIIGLLLSSYSSVGYYQFGMSIPDYKKLQSAVVAPGRWENFVKTRKNVDASEKSNIKNIFYDEKSMFINIAPIYPFTKLELKELPDSANKEATAGISAIKISYKSSTPELAQKGVILIGEYLRDTAILMNYRDSVVTKYTDYLSTQKKYENSVIEIKYQLTQMEIKKTSMQKILHDYPDSAKSDSRQLVSISEGRARYLSPVTQLVAIESSIADQTQSLPRIMRDQQINSLYLRYYEQLIGLLDSSTSGEIFLSNMQKIRLSLNLNLNDEVEKSVANNIDVENLNSQAFYLKKIRFIAEPTKSTRRSPSLLTSSFFGFLASVVFSCLYLFITELSRNSASVPVIMNRQLSKVATS